MSKSKNSINKTILISRTDSIGDVVLTLPVAGMCKKHFPQSRILFLGRNYTESVINCDSNINKFISWDNLQKLSEREQIEQLKSEKIDIILHVFPSKTIARLAYKVKIKQRIATSHRIYNWLYCNELINISRHNSDLHEAQLNLQLLQQLIPTFNLPKLNELSQYINFKSKAINPYSDLLKRDKFNLILHPKSSGSAREWSEANYGHLINLLPDNKFQIFICGTQQEGEMIQDQIIEPNKNKVINLTGKLTLAQYIAFIAEADGLIAASTGPLHIAAILHKHTIGLFPPIRPMHPARWQPIGQNVKVFCANHVCEVCRKIPQQCQCMQEITPEEIASYLINFTSVLH